MNPASARNDAIALCDTRSPSTSAIRIARRAPDDTSEASTPAIALANWLRDGFTMPADSLKQGNGLATIAGQVPQSMPLSFVARCLVEGIRQLAGSLD